MKTSTYQSHTSLLRGGRMTKCKGQAASFAPALGRVLCRVSVAAVGTAFAFGGGAAWGGSCVDQGGGNFTCSGPANDITPEATILIDEPVSPTVITTEPGFGHTATGDAIRVRDAGSVTFTDVNNSQITGEKDGLDIRADDGVSITTTGQVVGGDDGIFAQNINTGAMSIDVVDVTGATGHGIFANNSDGRSDNPPITDLTITASGTVQGGTNGIVASLGIFTAFYYPASGDLSINVADVVGADGYGIYAVGTGTDMSVTSIGHVQATQHGVLAINQGRGELSVDVADVTSIGADGIRAIIENLATDLSITASGTVTGQQNGIYTNNTGSGALTIDVADVSAENGVGIQAGNYGTDLSITATGAVTAAQDGIFAQNVGTGALTIDVVDVTSSSGQGIDASNGSTGTDLSITSTGHIQAAQHGILAVNQGTGALTIDVARVTSTDEHGISAVNSSQGTDLSITASGAVTVDDEGIYASNSGSGALTIDVTDVSSANGLGIQASNEGTDLSITATGTIQAAQDGINANNDGTGALTIEVVDVTSAAEDGIDATNGSTGTDLSITATGTITAEQDGIEATNQGTGALTINVADVSAKSRRGIEARQYGTDLSITATGAIQAGLAGISVDHTGTGSVLIDVADVTSTGDDGISAYLDSGVTGLTITSSGSITAEKDGIDVENLGSGATTINVVDVTSATGDGISASTSAPGSDLSITATGAITAALFGVKATNGGSGALTIDVTDVTSADEKGIDAFNRKGTDLTITASGTVSAADTAIEAVNDGSGNLTIAVNTVHSDTDYGIEAFNDNEYDSDLLISATGHVSGFKGIFADQGNSGVLSIDVADVTATGAHGILAISNGSDMSITASGTITAFENGIDVAQRGEGALNIFVADVTGGSEGGSGYGIYARGDDDMTRMTITSTGHVSGTTGGISAQTDGGDADMIIDLVDVTATSGNGIQAEHRGADLSIASSGTVAGSQNGIAAFQYGTGALTINAINALGENGRGIFAQGDGTDISVTATGDVAGLSGGILARNYGIGVTNVTVSGTVDSSNGPAIQAESQTTSLIVLLEGAVVAPESGQAVINGSDDGTVILRDGSRLSGSIAMNEGGDTLMVEGGADIGDATVIDGGGGTQDALLFLGFDGSFDSGAFTNWESLTALAGTSLALDSSDAGSLEAINITADSELTTSVGSFEFGGALQIESTSRFIVESGGFGEIEIGGNVFSDGLITLADGASGDRMSVGGDLTGDGIIGLDVNLTDGTNDALFVAGDTEGASQGIDVTTSGSTVDTAQVFTLVTVEGDNSATDFQLINGDFVTNDGAQAISDGEISYLLQHDEVAGTFALNPFNNGEVLLNPGGAFLAAGVEQLSRHMTFGSTLGRVMNVMQPNAEGAQTVSRALHDFSAATQPHFWVQASGESRSYSFVGRDVETTLGELRLGSAVPVAEIGNGRLVGGLEFGIGSLSSNLQTALTSASIKTHARDLTLSALWVADSQFYTDVQLRYARFDSTINPNGGVAVDVEGEGYGASVEFGMPFEMPNGLTLTPQAQLAYSDVDIHDVANLGGGGLTGSLSDGDNLTARIGLRAEQTFASGSMLFGQVDYYHVLDNETSVAFGSNSIATLRDQNSVALSIGGYMTISDTTSLIGEITGMTSVGASEKDRSLRGRLGFQIRF